MVKGFNKNFLVDCALFLIENLDAAQLWTEEPSITKKEETITNQAPLTVVAPKTIEKTEEEKVVFTPGQIFINLSELVERDLKGTSRIHLNSVFQMAI